MEKAHLVKKNLPDAPGVYFFLGVRKKILYIGKATSLKNRVRSYFAIDLKEKRSELIEKMVAEAVDIECTRTDSVLEALILETNLIRTHKPYYNTRSKDDKSYNHLIITNETWPRVLVVRGKDLSEKYTEQEIKSHFGPFPSGSSLREALKIVRKLFRFYDTSVSIDKAKSKLTKGIIDFNRQIGLYPDQVSKTEYARTIKHLILFFEGKKSQIIAELEKEMMRCAKREEFEAAHNMKKRIFALQHIQDVALIKDDTRVYRDEKRIRIEAYDIAHMQGKDMVGVMTVIESGEPARDAYRKFNVKTVAGANDPAALKEVLSRRFTHTEWAQPQIVVVDGSTAQKNVAEQVLKEYGLVIPVVAVVKDDHHKPIRLIGQKALLSVHQQSILHANAESHRFAITYHRQKRRKLF
ncbi:GIY-YIG nuclease family protein [Candidatus Kaiserbacteria bacterium]|nr:GIY-YIG nuclease family protein [Candidatus Kaiserbacteria bacterium]NCT02066.1 GIY-YIG nuclease family protein [Candidatus Parcubacteria bacterium]